MNRLHAAALALSVLLFSSPILGESIPAGALIDAGKVDWQWNVRIPMRDGVRLSATVYKPKPMLSARPCIFTLTPYIAQSYHDRGVYFAAHGYPFLTVDVRGRGNSEGEYHPLIQEAKDGYDVVEWLAKQPYCNGKVTMWGGSYAGYDQWATAKELPPHLATIVPAASPYAGVDFPSTSGIFAPYDIEWLTFTSGHTSQDHIFEDSAMWVGNFRRWVESGTSFRKLDTFVGNPSPIFQEWLSHPDMDDYWDSYNPTREQYARLQIPILTITGMYDDDQGGALAHYGHYMQATSPEGKARHFLIIGPWDHAGTRTPRREFNGMKFGPDSMVDLPQLHLDWYRYAMESGPKPAFLQKAVAYYVTGAERWRYADSLEGVTKESRPYYLDSSGDSAREIFSAGTLSPGQNARGAPDQYRYDPRDVSLARIESESDQDSVLDQRVAIANPAKLLYVSAPFPEPQELSGFFRLEAWISIDQKDTDFSVKVLEISPNGTATPLSSDLLRARYRANKRVPTLVSTKDPLKYEFTGFTFASRQICQGCRLEVLLSAANSLQLERNYNSGGVVADETRADAQVVNVSLFHDSKHRSALFVPIASP